MSRSFIAWLLVTVGLALLSVSVVLVPNTAFADDGSECEGGCVYQSDSTGIAWMPMSDTCTGIGCACPSVPNIDPPTGPGEQVQTDCGGNIIFCMEFFCFCSPPCTPIGPSCNWCTCPFNVCIGP